MSRGAFGENTLTGKHVIRIRNAARKSMITRERLSKYGLLVESHFCDSYEEQRKNGYKRYKFEDEATRIIIAGKELPPELETKLLDTLEERRKRDEAYYGKPIKKKDNDDTFIDDKDFYNLTGIDLDKWCSNSRNVSKVEQEKVNKIEKVLRNNPNAEENFIRKAQAYLRNKLARKKK